MTIDEFTRALEHLSNEQSNALSTYFDAERAYIAHIDECDEETFYISKCNAYDACKNLGIADEMMEVRDDKDV